MSQPDSPLALMAPQRRMTLSAIVELLLARGSADRSSVSLVRNARGETQIEVTVRASETSAVATVTEAETVAVEVFERLRMRYPMSTGYVGAPPPDAK